MLSNSVYWPNVLRLFLTKAFQTEQYQKYENKFLYNLSSVDKSFSTLIFEVQQMQIKWSVFWYFWYNKHNVIKSNQTEFKFFFLVQTLGKQIIISWDRLDIHSKICSSSFKISMILCDSPRDKSSLVLFYMNSIMCTSRNEKHIGNIQWFAWKIWYIMGASALSVLELIFVRFSHFMKQIW